MLEARGTDYGLGGLLGTTVVDNQDLLLPAPPPPPHVGYNQAACCRNTVKQLLLMKRQRWNQAQEDEENHAGPVKLLRLSEEVIPLPPLDLLGHMTPPPLQQQPSAKASRTLFQWQVQQEELRLGGVPSELLNTADRDGDTFLHIAVAKGRRALAFALAARMSASGGLDLKEHNGQTALQLAAATNQHLIVQDLLALGARVDTHDLWGRSALHVCAEKGHFLSLQSILRTLMGSGQHVHVDIFNYDGQTPLQAAVLSHNAAVRELRKLDSPQRKMELLQRKKVYLECIKVLLLMGASAGTQDLKSGRTSIHIACEEANVEVLSVLLHQLPTPSFINKAMFNGNTALHVACSLHGLRGQAEVVKLLLRQGADPMSRNTENEAPSQLVPEGPTGEKVLLLLKKKHV